MGKGQLSLPCWLQGSLLRPHYISRVRATGLACKPNCAAEAGGFSLGVYFSICGMGTLWGWGQVRWHSHGTTLNTHAGQAASGWNNRTEAPQTGDSPILARTSKAKLPGKPSEVPEDTGCSENPLPCHSLTLRPPCLLNTVSPGIQDLESGSLLKGGKEAAR